MPRIHFRADSRFAPSQWETALLCNGVSHRLGTNLESALHFIWQTCFTSPHGTICRWPFGEYMTESRCPPVDQTTILARPISILHIISTNFRRCVACWAFEKKSKIWIFADPFRISNAIFNARAFRFDTNVVISVTFDINFGVFFIHGFI